MKSREAEGSLAGYRRVLGTPAARLLDKDMVDAIDRKFTVTATSYASGKRYTENDGVFFKAEDPGVPDMLLEYLRKLRELGTDEHHLRAIELLHGRVVKYQAENGTKLPDVDPSKELYLFTDL